MKDYQEDSLNQDIELEDSDKEIRNETQKRERNLLGRKSRKPFLFILFGMICLVGLISIIIVGEIFKPDSTGVASEQGVSTKEDNPEIRSLGSSEAIKEGDLVTDNNEEQERLNALAEESRVYCIISSAPYFQDINSKGSLSISNPKESKYYTQVVIKTDDDKEMYVSPLLAPDEKIESDYLTNKDFKTGSYHCNAYFNYYASKDSSSYLGSMCAEINVVID
jgi:hypothetical protein